MSYLDIYRIREELVVFLRNSDIFSVGTRGVTTESDSFNGTGALLTFTLTPSTGSVRNVRSVTVSSVSKALGTDYTVNYSTGVVTFVVAPGSGTNNVVVSYDCGTSDKIFPDFPRPDISVSSFPRIGVDIISAKTEMAGFGNVHVTDFLITVAVYDFKSEDISNYIKAIRQAMIAARSSFYYIKLLTPNAIGPMIVSPNKNDKILMQTVDFNAGFNYEIN